MPTVASLPLLLRRGVGVVGRPAPYNWTPCGFRPDACPGDYLKSRFLGIADAAVYANFHLDEQVGYGAGGQLLAGQRGQGGVRWVN